MSKLHYIIDNGHGGIVNGKYTTSPDWTPDDPNSWNKMYVHDGKPIFEGVFNRNVVDVLTDLLNKDCIDHTILVPENEDISLPERIEREHELVDSYGSKNHPYVLISVHGNAGGGHGDEIWTYTGQNISDRYASNFYMGYSDILGSYGRTFRKDMSDGDIDKEAPFYMLKKSKSPSFLTENGFFDNEEDAKFMMSDEGVNAFACAHLKGIKKIEDYKSEF